MICTEADKDYLRTHYPHVTTDQLARLFGVSKRTIENWACKLGIRKKFIGQLAKPEIRKLAARDVGFVTNELFEQFDRHYISNLAHRMAKDGEIFSAKTAHKVVRYFATQEQADAWLRKHGCSVVIKSSSVVHGVTIPARKTWTREDWAAAPMIFAPGWKHTVAPKPDYAPSHTAWGCGLNSRHAA